MGRNDLVVESEHIRRASYDDIGELIKICRDSFSGSLRWQGARFGARRWWQFMVNSQYCETWILLNAEKIAGFVVPILDVDEYNKEKRKQYRSIRAFLPVLMSPPRLLITKASKRIFSHDFVKTRHAKSAGSKKLAANSLWIELIAVSPNMRRKGYGAALLKFCEQKAAELRYEGLKLSVKKKDTAAIGLYEKVGFVATAEGKQSYIYTKALIQ